jgi:Ras GTPase-activating-like protein IQGAP2/3
MVASVDIATRKNLAQISKVLTQVASGSEFNDDQPNYVPINECVRTLIMQMTNWLVRSELFFIIIFSVSGIHPLR